MGKLFPASSLWPQKETERTAEILFLFFLFIENVYFRKIYILHRNPNSSNDAERAELSRYIELAHLLTVREQSFDDVGSVKRLLAVLAR